MNSLAYNWESIIGIIIVIITLFPICFIRVWWNMETYNLIHQKNYIIFFQNWQKGGSKAGLVSIFIFWWTITRFDSDAVKRRKKIANRISIISIILFTLGTVGLYGLAYLINYLESI